MDTETLQRFRDGIAKGEFTLAEVADASGIPSTTLAYIRKADWGLGMAEKVEKIAAGLEKLAAKRSEAASHGGASTAA